MKKDHVVTLKTDASGVWIAVRDPASGKRGGYTVYRLYRWADKRADIVGREIDLPAARKLVGKGGQGEPDKSASRPSFRQARGRRQRENRHRDAAELLADHPWRTREHNCDWRKASLMLAKCVVATIQTDGKIGTGSGMVMKVVDGKRIIARWDKDFIEALAFIGIEMADKKPADKKKSKPTKAESKKPAASSRGARAA